MAITRNRSSIKSLDFSISIIWRFPTPEIIHSNGMFPYKTSINHPSSGIPLSHSTQAIAAAVVHLAGHFPELRQVGCLTKSKAESNQAVMKHRGKNMEKSMGKCGMYLYIYIYIFVCLYVCLSVCISSWGLGGFSAVDEPVNP